MKQFSPKIVYTVSEEVLFIPVEGIYTRQTIANGHKFILAATPQYTNIKGGGCWFRMVDDLSRRAFYIKPKYFDKIVEAK